MAKSGGTRSAKGVRKKPARATKIPIRFRLPNAPPVFVGRDAETARLSAALKRAPIAVVFGLGGLGKTSLVVHTIHAAFRDHVASTVMVALRATGGPEQAPLDIARALTEASGLALPDWSLLAGDRDGLLEMAIDIAESERFWVVLDDLHHVGAEALPSIITQIARVARDSRWVVTSRLDPALPDIAEQTIALGALDRPALVELVRSLAPSLSGEALLATVERAGGSPWKTRCALVAAHANTYGAGDRPLASQIPADAAPLVEVLSLLQKPCDANALAALVEIPAGETMRRLVQMGVLEPSDDALRLHDVARGMLEAEWGAAVEAKWRARLIAVFGASRDLDLVIEAVRLAAASKDIGALARLLGERMDDLVREGLEAALWRIIEPIGEPSVERFRLRLAVDLADPAVLFSLVPPLEQSVENNLYWSRALFLMGRFHESERAARDAVREAIAEGRTDLAVEAGLVRSESLGSLSRVPEAILALDEVAHLGEAARIRTDALRGQWFVLVGRFREALEIARSLPARVTALDYGCRIEIAQQATFVLHELGRMREAAEGLASAFCGHEGDAATRFRSRLSLGWLALTSTFSGHLTEARRMLDRLEPFARGFSVQTQFVKAIDLAWRIAYGDFDGLDEKLDEMFVLSRAAQDSFLVGRLLMLRGWHALITGRGSIEWPEDVAPPVGPEAFLIPLVSRQLALRAGVSASSPLPPAVDASVLVNVQTLVRIVDAEERLIAGDPSDAIRALQVALRTALESGDTVFETEARTTLCMAYLLAGLESALREAADDLKARALRFASPRVANEARFFGCVAKGGFFAAGAFEELAAAWGASPRAARWARAMLGQDAALDRLDRLIVNAVRARTGNLVVETVGGTAADDAWHSGWGLDETRHCAWLPDGRAVDLKEQPQLWQLLVAIARAGGAITKEALVLAVWQTADYHPLRDDKRMQVAIRRARTFIEDDAANPTRLVTTEAGYAFGHAEPVRLVRARTDESNPAG